MKKLVFTNYYHVEVTGDEDKPFTHEFEVSDTTDVGPIIEWYGSFYSGDPYIVTLNGVRLKLDMNGAVEPMTIEGAKS